MFFLIFSFFIACVVIENAKLKLAVAVPIVRPIVVVKEAIDVSPPVADKTIKTLSK